eukprot:s986_g17.t1
MLLIPLFPEHSSPARFNFYASCRLFYSLSLQATRCFGLGKLPGCRAARRSFASSCSAGIASFWKAMRRYPGTDLAKCRSTHYRFVLPNLVPAKRAPPNHPVGAQPICIFLPAFDLAAQLSGHRNSLPWPGLAVRSPRYRSHWGGGWGPIVVKTWRELGDLYAVRLGLTASEGIEQLLQSLSVMLQRENARAVLRRLPEAGEEGRGPLLELSLPWSAFLLLVTHSFPSDFRPTEPGGGAAAPWGAGAVVFRPPVPGGGLAAPRAGAFLSLARLSRGAAYFAAPWAGAFSSQSLCSRQFSVHSLCLATLLG